MQNNTKLLIGGLIIAAAGGIIYSVAKSNKKSDDSSQDQILIPILIPIEQKGNSIGEKVLKYGAKGIAKELQNDKLRTILTNIFKKKSKKPTIEEMSTALATAMTPSTLAAQKGLIKSGVVKNELSEKVIYNSIYSKFINMRYKLTKKEYDKLNQYITQTMPSKKAEPLKVEKHTAQLASDWKLI